MPPHVHLIQTVSIKRSCHKNESPLLSELGRDLPTQRVYLTRDSRNWTSLTFSNQTRRFSTHTGNGSSWSRVRSGELPTVKMLTERSSRHVTPKEYRTFALKLQISLRGSWRNIMKRALQLVAPNRPLKLTSILVRRLQEHRAHQTEEEN